MFKTQKIYDFRYHSDEFEVEMSGSYQIFEKNYFTLIAMKSHSNFTGFKVLILIWNTSRNVEKLLELDCILFIVRQNISGKACKSILLLMKGTIFNNKSLKIINIHFLSTSFKNHHRLW